jgi:hypothetical protein
MAGRHEDELPAAIMQRRPGETLNERFALLTHTALVYRQQMHSGAEVKVESSKSGCPNDLTCHAGPTQATAADGFRR